MVKNQPIWVSVPSQPNRVVREAIGSAHNSAPIRARRSSFQLLKRACSGVGVSSSMTAAPKDFCAAPCPPVRNFSGARRPPK
ncbi:hypothetical protein D3C76_1646160 [compost metagenome]